jgi:hypothetical protein
MPSSRFSPGKLFIRTRFNYEKVPGAESGATSPLPLFSSKTWGPKGRQPAWATRLQRPRMSFARLITLVVGAVMVVVLIASGVYRRHRWNQPLRHGESAKLYHWEHYPR